MTAPLDPPSQPDRAALLLWADDDAAIADTPRFTVGEPTHGRIGPLAPDLTTRLAVIAGTALPVQNRILTTPSRDTPTLHDGDLEGTVEALTAIIWPYRIGPAGVFVPQYPRARTMHISTDGGPLPGRNIWPGSGKPVLAGFIVHLTVPAHSLPAALRPRHRVLRPRRTPAAA